MNIIVGQEFYSKARIETKYKHFKYLGKDDSDSCYNIKIEEINTGEISLVEPEWFRQRKIKWL